MWHYSCTPKNALGLLPSHSSVLQTLHDFPRFTRLWTPLDALCSSSRPSIMASYLHPLLPLLIPSTRERDTVVDGSKYNPNTEGKGREGTHGLHCLPSHGPLIDLVGREVLDPSPRSTPGADQGSSRPLVEPCVVSTLSGRPPLRKRPSTDKTIY